MRSPHRPKTPPSSSSIIRADSQTAYRPQSPPEFVNNVKALVTIAQIYKLPSVITTSAADGPNGPVMPVVAEGLPKATVVHRPDEFGAADLGLDARGPWQSPPEVVAADQDVLKRASMTPDVLC